MKNSIQLKIVFIYLCVVVIIMIISGSLIIYNIEDRQYRETITQLMSKAEFLKSKLDTDSNGNHEIVWEEIEKKLTPAMAMEINNSKIYILDSDGRVKIGGDELNRTGKRVGKDVVIDAINTKEPATVKVVHFANRDTGPQVLDYAMPILDDEDNILYIIYIAVDTKSLYDNIESVMKTMVMGSFVAMLIAGVLGLVFAQMITTPIVQLTKSAKKLTQGDYIRIPIPSGDEIGELTKTFNYMATELKDTMSITTSEKNKLEKILENMADGVMAFNRQGVMIHANQVSYEILGEASKNHRFDDIFPKLGIEVDFDDVIAGNVTVIEEKLAESEDKYYNIRFAPYSNVSGEGEGVIVVMQDITKQHKLDAMRKEFVANVSHELRTPLTTVKSYTETLLDGALEDKEVAVEFLKVMEKEADRMTALVQDLLDLTRIDNKQIQLNMRPLNLRELVDDTIAAQRIHAEKKSHKLIFEADFKERYLIMGDNERMRQVLHNILSNAIKYSIDPGTIKIKLFKQDRIVLQVEDSGIGISKQDLERIFERFYRVDKARSRNMGGTGLGLSIAKELVELQGGTIKINSKVGKGTTVTLSFPLVTKC